jgi:uncharacterized protein YbjT (DUF2867 family)
LANIKTALIAGSTGLIGQELAEQIAADNYYGEVYLIVRKETQRVLNSCKELVVDFDNLQESLAHIHVDDVYCCLGTTMKMAGSREAFHRVDFQYPVEIAKIMKKNGAEVFLLVSALGANTKSMIFYNRVKGKVEEALKELGFRSLVIFRPSLLLGDRKEKRVGEDIAKKTYKVLDRLFIGPLKKYAGIHGKVVAHAMQEMGKRHISGVTILESDEIKKV